MITGKILFQHFSSIFALLLGDVGIQDSAMIQFLGEKIMEIIKVSGCVGDDCSVFLSVYYLIIRFHNFRPNKKKLS